MATCKWCNKSGFFLSLSNNGLCNNCEIKVFSDIRQRAKLINESSKIISDSSDIDTIISRFDFVIENAKALLPYEQKGIVTIKPLPSYYLGIAEKERDNHIIYGLEKEFEKLKLKLGKLKTIDGRVENIRKFPILVAKYKSQISNPKLLLSPLEKSYEELLNENKGNKSNKQIEGLIAYYSLEEWWLSSFTEQEQTYIESRCQSMGSLTKGDSEISLTKTEFLSSMVSWFKSKSDLSIAERIRREIVEVGEIEPVIKPGYFKGRHFSTYPLDVEALIGEGKLIGAETLLLNLVDTTESESNAKYSGVAPWFYEKLAILYRKQKDYVKEVEILERFSKQKHAPGVTPPKLLERLKKVKELLKSKK